MRWWAASRWRGKGWHSLAEGLSGLSVLANKVPASHRRGGRPHNEAMVDDRSGAQARRWARLDGVDCLRALAIVYVLLNHVNMRLWGAHIPYTQGLPRQLVTALVWQGQAGVQIFFAVSGFLITATAIRRWGTLAEVPIRTFYGMRLARIAPLLLTLLVVLSVLHLAQAPDYVVSKDVGGLAGSTDGGVDATGRTAGGDKGISSGELGHPVVAVGGGAFFICASRWRAGCWEGAEGWCCCCWRWWCWGRLRARC